MNKWTHTAGTLLLGLALYLLADIDSMLIVVAALAVAGAALIGKAK